MSPSTAEILSQAYELIESDELLAARKLLEPILEVEPDNANAWWLYAHAVEDSEVGRNALAKVAELKPDYPGISGLMDEVEESEKPYERTALRKLSPNITSTPPPMTLPDETIQPNIDDDLSLDFDEDSLDIDTLEEDVDELDFDTDIEPEKVQRPGWLQVTVPVVGILLIVSVLALIFMSLGNGEIEATPQTNETDIAQAPTATLVPTIAEATSEAAESAIITSTSEGIVEVGTEQLGSIALTATAVVQSASETAAPTETLQEDTETPMVSPTEDSDEDEQSNRIAETATAIAVGLSQATSIPENDAVGEAIVAEDPLDALFEEFTSLEVSSGDIEIDDTELGDTLLVGVCATVGPQATVAIGETMNIAVENGEVLANEVDALGVQIIDCTSDTINRVVGVTVDDIVARANDEIDERDFQRLWQPIR